jgi:hypothetical protein
VLPERWFDRTSESTNQSSVVRQQGAAGGRARSAARTHLREVSRLCAAVSPPLPLAAPTASAPSLSAGIGRKSSVMSSLAPPASGNPCGNVSPPSTWCCVVQAATQHRQRRCQCSYGRVAARGYRNTGPVLGGGRTLMRSIVAYSRAGPNSGSSVVFLNGGLPASIW